MERLFVEPRYQPLFHELGLKSGADIIRLCNATGTSASRNVLITSTTLARPGGDPLTVFCKQYRFARPSWRFWARPSKARREYQNYEVFARLGVPCAERVACSESRDWLGRLRHAFILTRAVPNVGTLLAFVQKRHPNRDSAEARNVRDALAGQLAEMTRRIHQAGFFHNDLYWRNILVEWAPGQEPTLWWIDCPRGRFGRWPGSGYRRQIKDLAALDLWASKLCPATERLRFIKRYLGTGRLDQRGKAMVRDVVLYRRKRWPEDELPPGQSASRPG